MAAATSCKSHPPCAIPPDRLTTLLPAWCVRTTLSRVPAPHRTALAHPLAQPIARRQAPPAAVGSGVMRSIHHRPVPRGICLPRWRHTESCTTLTTPPRAPAAAAPRTCMHAHTLPACCLPADLALHDCVHPPSCCRPGLLALAPEVPPRRRHCVLVTTICFPSHEPHTHY